MILNLEHLRTKKPPYFYIGSKKDITKFSDYWGSSTHVLNDVAALGPYNFKKLILSEIEFSEYGTLLDIELQYQKKFDVVNSKLFYNKTFASREWKQALGPNKTSNTMWVNNSIENKRIPKNLLAEFESLGYISGRLSGNFMQNRIYIHNGSETKAISTNELYEYTKNGWSKGRISGNNKNKKSVTKNGKNKLIDISEVSKYISEGWSVGQIQNHKSKD